MNLQIQPMAEVPWEGASLESNFRLESKAQSQNLHTTGRVKLTIPWKTRNKLLCNASFIIILFFRDWLQHHECTMRRAVSQPQLFSPPKMLFLHYSFSVHHHCFLLLEHFHLLSWENLCWQKISWKGPELLSPHSVSSQFLQDSC